MLGRQRPSIRYGRSKPARRLAIWLVLTLIGRFLFPSEPSDGIVDLTMVERAFYFNPYSGELSLEFPKAEVKCPGGILA